MPLTINQLRSMRVRAAYNIRRHLKRVDTQVEVMQRLVDRWIGYKDKIIEEEDFLRLSNIWSDFRSIVNQTEKDLANEISAVSY